MKGRQHPRVRLVLLGMVVLLFLGACAGGAPEAPAQEGAPAQQAPAEAPAQEAQEEAPAGPTVVEVSLTEFAIEMPAELPAGLIRFEVKNDGAFLHNIRIVGQGIDVALASDLTGGQSGTLEVELPAGTYRVYCPVGSHAQRGMDMTLTVTGG